VAEVPVALAAVWVFFCLCRSFASRIWAAGGTALFAPFSTVPSINRGGNLTETYDQLPVVLAYFFLLRYAVLARTSRTDPGLWMYPIFSGACVGAATLLTPQAALNIIALVVGVVLVEQHRRLRRVGILCAAALLVAGLPLADFGVRAGFGTLWGEAVRYNQFLGDHPEPRRRMAFTQIEPDCDAGVPRTPDLRGLSWSPRMDVRRRMVQRRLETADLDCSVNLVRRRTYRHEWRTVLLSPRLSNLGALKRRPVDLQPLTTMVQVHVAGGSTAPRHSPIHHDSRTRRTNFFSCRCGRLCPLLWIAFRTVVLQSEGSS
jgi:hypothetical protein